VYALFSSRTGGLLLAFIRTESGVHQIIAPSSQFISGTSDPANWNLEAGVLADPEVIPGAFGQPGGPYHASLGDGTILFDSQSGDGISHRFRLLPDGIRFEALGFEGQLVQGAVAPDPWLRFSPGWTERYRHGQTPGGWQVELLEESGSALQIEIHTNGVIDMRSFLESHAFTGSAENPYRDYPPGHYLPFPMFFFEISGTGEVFVEIRGKEI
jgi:hypothetical protein